MLPNCNAANKIAVCSESELHNYVTQEWLCCRYIRTPGVLIRVPVGGRVELADGSRYQCCGADSYSTRNNAGSDWMAGWVTGYLAECGKKMPNVRKCEKLTDRAAG
jgi:hypothetical protein